MKGHKVYQEALEPLVLLGRLVYEVPVVTQAPLVPPVIQDLPVIREVLDSSEKVVSLGLLV